jgi:hypothetical protein
MGSGGSFAAVTAAAAGGPSAGDGVYGTINKRGGTITGYTTYQVRGNAPPLVGRYPCGSLKTTKF